MLSYDAEVGGTAVRAISLTARRAGRVVLVRRLDGEMPDGTHNSVGMSLRNVWGDGEAEVLVDLEGLAS